MTPLSYSNANRISVTSFEAFFTSKEAGSEASLNRISHRLAAISITVLDKRSTLKAVEKFKPRGGDECGGHTDQTVVGAIVRT